MNDSMKAKLEKLRGHRASGEPAVSYIPDPELHDDFIAGFEYGETHPQATLGDARAMAERCPRPVLFMAGWQSSITDRCSG